MSLELRIAARRMSDVYWCRRPLSFPTFSSSSVCRFLPVQETCITSPYRSWPNTHDRIRISSQTPSDADGHRH